MQWLKDFWTKEGPGIPKNAPRKRGLALFAEILRREWWEMVKLNLLFIIASLPLVTIPAALAATTSVSLAHVEDRNSWLLRDFTEAFRRFFLRATLLGIVLTVALALGGLAVTTYAAAARDSLVNVVPLSISLVATAFIAVFACHMLVLMVMQTLPIGQLVRLAALASIMRPLPVLASLGFIASLWLAHVLFYPVSVFMPATLNFSLGTFAIVFGAHKAATAVLALPVAEGAKATEGTVRNV